MDAILHIRTQSKQTITQGGIALAVSIDIVNAFNSVPLTAIKNALVYHQFPLYLQAIVGDYLCSRFIKYLTQDGCRVQREVYCGVPQGSVLGP